MKRKLTPRHLYAIVVGGLLVYALFGWFVLVGPKRAAVVTAKEEAASVQVTLATARAALLQKDDKQPIAVADIFRLATAMPSVPDMPGILLELSRIAQEAGLEFNGITPGASTVAGTYQEVPISLALDGNFYELSDFLFRLRTLVGVRNSELHSNGRLFLVNSIDFAEASARFPQISANLTVNAFVYGTGAPASDVPPAPATEAPGAPATPAAPETTTGGTTAAASP